MTAHPVTTPARPPDDVHVPFLIASLIMGTFGGFALAVTMPVEGLLDSVDISWVAHAQVHGHMQVVGFAGLFVIGMALRFAPRFGGRRTISLPHVVPWAFWLLLLGLVARGVGQPLAGHAPFAVAMVLGAACELVASALVLVILYLTLADAVHDWQPHALLLVGAGAGLVAQAGLGLWWILALAMERNVALPALEGRVLLHLQFFGVLLPAILGVGLRSFPTFFGRTPPSRRAGGMVAWLALGGVTVWTVGGVLAAQRSVMAWPWSDVGQAMTGFAILTAIWIFGPWRSASRLAAASKGLAWSIHPAVLWLAVTGVLLVVLAVRSAASREMPATMELDAARHVFGLGTVTLAIAGMAQLVLPEFASERLVRAPGAWRGPFFGITLTLATALRGVGPLAGVQGDLRWWSMAVAGVLGWIAVATLSVLFWRARRSHRAYLRRIARFQQDGLPVLEGSPPSQ